MGTVVITHTLLEIMTFNNKLVHSLGALVYRVAQALYSDIHSSRFLCTCAQFVSLGQVLKVVLFSKTVECWERVLCTVKAKKEWRTRPSVNYAKDWLNHSFLFPGLEKGFTLDVITRGRSSAIFLCIGPFLAWWQPNNRMTLVQACSWPVRSHSFANKKKCVWLKA